MPKTFWKLVGVIVLGFALQAAGRFSNQTVMSANHDKMPVWMINDEMGFGLDEDPRHSVLTSKSKYPALADILPIWEPDDGGIEVEGVMSLGDIGIFSGRSLVVVGIAVLGLYTAALPFILAWKFLVDRIRNLYA